MQRRGAGASATRVNPGDFFAFEGGLNLVDPPLTVAPGQLLGCKNYEPGVRGGYRRTDGYERFDGQSSPTDTPFVALQVSGVAGTPFTPGATLRQYPAGTTAVANASGEIAFADQDGDWFVVVIGVTGTFQKTGDIRVGDPAPGTLVGSGVESFPNSGPTDPRTETFISGKTEYLRAKISAVPGNGPCRGVAVYRDNVVAFRDDGSVGKMYRQSATGWELVPLGSKIRFDTGGPEIVEGDVLTGAISGATATVRRVVAFTGLWTQATANGFVVTDAITGTFQTNETLRRSGVNVAKFLSSEAQTLPAGGRYRFRIHNFFGSLDKRRLYGVNEVGNAFEWDGETFTLIETGMFDDRPTRVFVINDHLGLCYRGGSVQNSGFQNPLLFNPIFGADERSVGADVTGVVEETGRTVFIGTRFQTFVFDGDVVENFQLRLFSPETGMIPDTAARLGQTLYLDDRGFTSLQASAQFGNFQSASLSDKILPLVEELVKRPIVDAVIRRDRNLYRCFFADGTGMVISSRPGGKFSGWTQVVYPDTAHMFYSGEFEEGQVFKERVFMAGVNGFVYELDKGRSFDGLEIEHFIRLTYHHSGSPEVVKHYRKAVIDMEVNGPVSFFLASDYNYGRRSGPFEQNLPFDAGGGFWGIANWSQFKWSSPAFDQLILKLEGSGFNVGLYFYGRSNVEVAHTLYNIVYHHSRRRIQRGNEVG